MEWNAKKARERLISKNYQVKFFLSWVLGATVAGIFIAFFTKEGFSNFLHRIIAFSFGGLLGLVIMYFLLKDKRFM